MLEIFLVWFLSKKNGEKAAARGRKPGVFKGITWLFWFVFEFIGAIVGFMLGFEMGAYLFALVFAGIGALIAYLIASNCAPGDYWPQQAAPYVPQGYQVPGGQQPYQQPPQGYQQPPQGHQPPPQQYPQYQQQPLAQPQSTLDPSIRDQASAYEPKDPSGPSL